MNKLAKKMANREGFTLVELIVVIAILGILAGIAIPVYSGYIKKANEAAIYQELDAIKTAAVFAFTEDHVNDATIPEVTKIVVTSSSVKVNSDTTEYATDDDFKSLLGGTFSIDFSKVTGNTATWNKTADTTSGAKEGWTIS